MKVVIITAPMRQPDQIKPVQYPVDGNKAIEYEKSIRCPVNGVLAKTMKKDEQVRVIYIMTRGENSECEQNRKNFIDELEGINTEIGAVLSYDTVEIDFLPTKQTYNKLLTDLTEKIPENAEIFTDITFGFKPEILSLFCALRFVEEFRDAIVQYIVYGKAEFNKETGEIEHPLLFDITSLYYLFSLMGSMKASDADSASKKLKDFFAL
jgi:hypothetical protein